MRSLVFLALAIIMLYAANGAKPSNLGRYNQTSLLTDGKKPPAVCNCNLTTLTVNQDSQFPGAVKNLEMKLDKILAQNVDTKIEKLLERNSKIPLERLIGLINKTAPPDFVTTTSSNETDNCDSALKKMETNLEKLIIKKLETKLEKLLQQNLETKLERLTALINKTGDREIVTKSLNATCDAAFKKLETKLEKIRILTNKAYLSAISPSASCKELFDTHNSLYSLIADGRYRATSLGRNKWKTMIGSQASLQTNCNKEGFNSICSCKRSSKARIGITSNENNDCHTCDSRIGFGTGGIPNNSSTCGNEASYSPDNGDKHIMTMGYILVQY